jgi:hypothetical protein
MNGNGRGRFGLYDNSAIRVGATDFGRVRWLALPDAIG